MRRDRRTPGFSPSTAAACRGIGLQVIRDLDRRPFEPQAGMLWFRSGESVKRMSLGYDTIVADVYWMRAVVYYGGERLSTTTPPNYDLLYSLLDLVTTLDPRFSIAYRFGAIFLAEAYRAVRVVPSRRLPSCSAGSSGPAAGSTCTTPALSTTGGCATTRKRPAGSSAPRRCPARRPG